MDSVRSREWTELRVGSEQMKRELRTLKFGAVQCTCPGYEVPNLLQKTRIQASCT